LSFEESPKRKKKKVDFSKLDFCWTFRVVKDDPKATPIVRVSWYRILVKIRGYFDMRHTFEKNSGFWTSSRWKIREVPG
jgi:hypothetical protein